LRVVTGSLPEEPWPLEEIDTVVHLAAARPTGNRDRASFFEVNAEGTRRLLDHAAASEVQRFVFVSSQAVYGTERTPPWPETMSPDPETPYGLSKWIGEQLCMNTGAVETTALRVARVFGKGPNMRWEPFPHNYIANVYQNEPLEVYGDGAQRMDLVHVSDVCSAIATACTVGMPSSRHAIFNIGSGNPIAVHDIARLVQERARERGQPAPEIMHCKTQEEWPDFGMDVRRAQTHLNWAPQASVEDAVKELICAYVDCVC
jgi:UDP-glucose 4-epimerase